jgi:hypothetical protein
MHQVRRLVDNNIFGGKWLSDLNADLHGSDRSCAVLAGALLDEQVRSLLLAYLLPPDKKNEDRLLGRSGALESFSSRIELSCRLNLITEDTRIALNWVREIRNDASHKPDFSFNEDAIRSRVENIIDMLDLKKRAPDMFLTPYDSRKGAFVAAVTILISGLQLEVIETQRTSHQPNDAMNTATFSFQDG